VSRQRRLWPPASSKETRRRKSQISHLQEGPAVRLSAIQDRRPPAHILVSITEEEHDRRSFSTIHPNQQA
jgi:hypothetical protein